MHPTVLLQLKVAGTALKLIVIVVHMAIHHDLMASDSRCMGGVFWVVDGKLVLLCRWMTAAEMTIDLGLQTAGVAISLRYTSAHECSDISDSWTHAAAFKPAGS